jgi:hypothetical protein
MSPGNLQNRRYQDCPGQPRTFAKTIQFSFGAYHEEWRHRQRAPQRVSVRVPEPYWQPATRARKTHTAKRASNPRHIKSIKRSTTTGRSTCSFSIHHFASCSAAPESAWACITIKGSAMWGIKGARSAAILSTVSNRIRVASPTADPATAAPPPNSRRHAARSCSTNWK